MGIVEIDGRRAHVLETGLAQDAAAPLALLAHGSLGHGGSWRWLTDMCADRFRLIAPDFPGYGRSDPTPADGRPAFVADAAMLMGLLEQQDRPAHLVGRDYGAAIAARVALSMPRRVASLTLVEPFAFFLLEEAKRPERFEAQALGYHALALAGYDDKRAPARMMTDFLRGAGAFESAEPESQVYAMQMIERLAADWRALALDAPGQLRLADFARIEAPTRLITRIDARESVRAVVDLLTEEMRDARVATAPSMQTLMPVVSVALDDLQKEVSQRRRQPLLPFTAGPGSA